MSRGYRQERDEEQDDVSIAGAEVIRETAAAVLVALLEDEDLREVWIPKSVIRDESEVWSMKNAGPGTLVVAGWFAEKEELG